MKRLITIVAFCIAQFGIAQEKDILISKSDLEKKKDENSIYHSAEVEVKPEYPGGLLEFMKFVRDNFKVPEDKDFKGGKMVVELIIEKDGSVGEVKTIKDIGFGTSDEAVRVLKLSEKWKPATHSGVPVRCSYMLPIALAVN